ncbi:MAG: peroxiredoxin [bacterium]
MALESSIKVGKCAPNFTMTSTKGATSPLDLGQPISLEDYSGKWLVLFFYPLDFTFVCPTEILSFSDSYGHFVDLNTEVLGVSVDSIYSHWAWVNTPIEENGIKGLRYPLASDITKEVARSYGVLIEEEGIALRGLFIIDPQGVLQYVQVTNLNVGRSVGETLRILEALQTGGLCPADWRPGQDLLKIK